MNNKVKHIVITVVFTLFLISLLILNVIKKPDDISVSERRKLKGFPSFSFYSIINGSFFTEFEDFTKDQFILRDEWRSIKAFIHFNVYRQKDNNNIYIADGSVIKIDYPLNEQSVYNAAKKLNTLYGKYMSGMNVMYSVIPDKNYYTAEKYGYPSIDYKRMIEILNHNVKRMAYIDITECLTIDDYYKTDIHWRQEKLDRVLKKLASDMRFITEPDMQSYKVNKKYPFYGVYYGQSALNIPPDALIYLTKDNTDKADVHYYDTDKYGSIYLPEKFSGVDPYDLYLSGPAAIVIIENNNAKTDKELIFFRDSFGSSLAPLLTEEYAKITLVDLRYVNTDYLGKIIEFNNQDILIMLNTQIINNSYMLR